MKKVSYLGPKSLFYLHSLFQTLLMTLKQTGNRKCSDFAERLVLQVYWMSMVGSSSLLDLGMDLD